MKHETAHVNPSQLTPNPHNAREHSEKQILMLMASIRDFGFNAPILVDEADMVLAGHARLTAAIRLGLDRVPVVRLIGLEAPQKRAYMLVDNRIGDMASWDETALLEALRGLEEVSFNLADFGFETSIKEGTDVREHTGEGDHAFFEKTKEQYEAQEMATLFLFFDAATGEDFLAKCDDLLEVYKAKTLPELMMELVNEAHNR